MALRFLDWLRRRPQRRAWVAELSRRQRRVLARNLRELVESKAELDRRLKRSAPLREACSR